jgi:hypothetical protein
MRSGVKPTTMPKDFFTSHGIKKNRAEMVLSSHNITSPGFAPVTRVFFGARRLVLCPNLDSDEIEVCPMWNSWGYNVRCGPMRSGVKPTTISESSSSSIRWLPYGLARDS